MKKESTITTKKLVLAALMAALTVVGSAIRVQMPISVGGTTAFHLGNIFCALSGLLLGPWLGGLAAGLGSFLYDIMTNYISECWITFLTKGAYGLVAGLVAWKAGKMNWNYLKATVATTAAAKPTPFCLVVSDITPPPCVLLVFIIYCTVGKYNCHLF